MNFLALMVVLLLVVPLLVIGVGGVLFVLAEVLPNSSRRERKTFACPWTRRVVTADFVVPEGAPHPSEVVSCTAFAEPERITCKKPCRELAETRWAVSRGAFPRWALTANGTVTWRSPAESSELA